MNIKTELNEYKNSNKIIILNNKTNLNHYCILSTHVYMNIIF